MEEYIMKLQIATAMCNCEYSFGICFYCGEKQKGYKPLPARCHVCGKFRGKKQCIHSEYEMELYHERIYERQQAEEDEFYYQQAAKAGAICEYCDAIGCSPERHERGY